MKKREKENVNLKQSEKKKKILIGIGIFSIILLIVGVSYAWWTSTAVQQSINKITSDCLSLEIEDVNNSAINLEKAYPITDAEANLLTPYSFKIKNVCNNSSEYSVNLEIMDLGENQLSSQYLSMNFNGEGKKRLTDYQSVDPTYKKSDYTANEARALTTGVLNAKESVTYSLKIWMDESVTIDDPTMNKEWIGKISVTSSLIQIASNTFSEYLINKSKTDTSIEQLNHDETDQTSALTDYRYVGANPNNYVYFGCSDNCTEDNLYRVIGVLPTQSTESGEYKNRVKLIKANYYIEEESGLLKDTNATYPAGGGSGKGYQWNSSASNQWQTSTLQSRVLNGVYWNSLGEYQGYIEQAKWYLGAPHYDSYTTYTPDEFYNIERSNTKGYSGGETNFIGNIGLMYPSDYGYSIGNGYREESVYNNSGKYVSDAWLYNLESKYYEWTMTPESGNSRVRAWYLYPAGYLCYDNYVSDSSFVWGVRPTFYLKEDVMYKSGNGSIDNPYKISLNTENFSDYLINKSNQDTSIVKVDHEATEQTTALEDYRYVGSNPNNYVYFGCEGNECTEDNLYRIIGVLPTQSSENGEYENRVKLIKANSWAGETSVNSSTALGGKGYIWNNENNNKWEASTLKGILNGEYYSSLGEYQKYIGLTKWYLGGALYRNYTENTTDGYYISERGNVPGNSQGALFTISNIGLMYLSDYGYSMEVGDSSLWKTQSIYQNREEYKSRAWLYNLENQYYEWTMTPEASHTDSGYVFAWLILPGGYPSLYHGVSQSRYMGVRPTFYLKSSVQYTSGDGSINNPYRIG